MKVLVLVVFIRLTEAFYIPIIRNPYAQPSWISSINTGDQNDGVTGDETNNVLNLQRNPSPNYQHVNVNIAARSITDAAGRPFVPEVNNDRGNGNRVTVQFGPLDGSGRSFSLLEHNDLAGSGANLQGQNSNSMTAFPQEESKVIYII